MPGARPVHAVPAPAVNVGAEFRGKVGHGFVQGGGQGGRPVLAVGEQGGVAGGDSIGYQVAETVEEHTAPPVGGLPEQGGRFRAEVVLQQLPEQGVAQRAVNCRFHCGGVHTARPGAEPPPGRRRGRMGGRGQGGQRGRIGLGRQRDALGVNAPHIVGRRVGQGGDARGNAPRPVAGGKVQADIVRVVGADGAVVGRYDIPLRRVEAAGHCGKGYAALPFVPAAPARHGQRGGRIPGAARDFAPALVADAAMAVGQQQVVHRVNPAFHSVGQFGNAAAFQHCRQDVRPGVAPVGGGVAQGDSDAGQRVAGNDRAVMGGPGAEVDGGAAAHFDDFVAHIGAVPVALPLVEGGVSVIEPFQVQVLIIPVGMRNAPGHLAVVSKMGEAGNAGKGNANHIKAVAGQVVLIIDAGDVRRAMAVAGEDRLAGGGAFPG